MATIKTAALYVFIIHLVDVLRKPVKLKRLSGTF
jgi:hypothetical protein